MSYIFSEFGPTCPDTPAAIHRRPPLHVARRNSQLAARISHLARRTSHLATRSSQLATRNSHHGHHTTFCLRLLQRSPHRCRSIPI